MSSSLLSIVVMNPPTKGSLGRKEFLWLVISFIEDVGQKLKAENWAQKPSTKAAYCLVLLAHGQLAFLASPSCIAQELYPPQQSWILHISHRPKQSFTYVATSQFNLSHLFEAAASDPVSLSIKTDKIHFPVIPLFLLVKQLVAKNLISHWHLF